MLKLIKAKQVTNGKFATMVIFPYDNMLQFFICLDGIFACNALVSFCAGHTLYQPNLFMNHNKPT